MACGQPGLRELWARVAKRLSPGAGGMEVAGLVVKVKGPEMTIG